MKFIRIAALLAVMQWAGSAQAQEIFVTNELDGGGGEVGAYTAAGKLINSSYVSVPSGGNPVGLAASTTNLYVACSNLWTVSDYTRAGGTVNQSFVPSNSLDGPTGMVVAGGNLYVANSSDDFVSEYNATTGAVENDSLVTFPSVNGNFGVPSDVAVSGSDLYVLWSVNGNSSSEIGEYSATTGAAINAFLVTSLPWASDIAVSGNQLFVSISTANAISEYNATTGALVNSQFIGNVLDHPEGIQVYGNDLFVVNHGTINNIGVGDGTVGEFTTSGALVNRYLVTGLTGPWSIAITPEPSTWAMLLIGAGSLLAFGIRRRCPWAI